MKHADKKKNNMPWSVWHVACEPFLPPVALEVPILSSWALICPGEQALCRLTAGKRDHVGVLRCRSDESFRLIFTRPFSAVTCAKLGTISRVTRAAFRDGTVPRLGGQGQAAMLCQCASDSTHAALGMILTMLPCPVHNPAFLSLPYPSRMAPAAFRCLLSRREICWNRRCEVGISWPRPSAKEAEGPLARPMPAPARDAVKPAGGPRGRQQFLSLKQMHWTLGGGLHAWKTEWKLVIVRRHRRPCIPHMGAYGSRGISQLRARTPKTTLMMIR